MGMSNSTGILPGLADIAVYLAIAVVTLIGVFKCLIPLWTTSSALRKAIVRLQNDSGHTSDHPVWQESHFVGNRLRGSWLRFLQNAEQLDRRGLPTNVEDYINDDTVTHGPGNATLAELIPNLLTSLGILGTFMGLYRGLSTLNFENASELIAGIPNLLSGMHFAFGTSVAGISCSIVFNMLNRILQGASYRSIDDFVTSFTQLAMSRPLDNDVQLICQNQDRNFMLQGINDNLIDRLADSVGRSMTLAMNPVTDTMDRFIVGATRNQIEGVNHIVTRFLEEMDRRLGNNFSAMAGAMSQVTDSQIAASGKIGETLTSAESIVKNARSVQEVTNSILDRFDAYLNAINVVRERDENYERRTADLLSKMQQENKDLASLISDLSKVIQEMNDVSVPCESSFSELNAVMSSLNDRVQKISDTLSSLSKED